MPMNGRTKSYNSTTFVIIDAPPDATPGPDDYVEKHDYNCRKMEMIHKEYSDFEVVKIRLPPRSRPDHFYKRVDEILSSKNTEDLVIFYYHGDAGDLDDDFEIKFNGPPTKGVEGYKFIEQCYKTSADCMLILDCWIQEVWENPWSRREGNTEIFSRGAQWQNGKGQQGDCLGKDYADTILRGIPGFVNEMVELGENYPGDQWKTRATQTLLQLLPKKGRYNKPRRINNKYRKQKSKAIKWKLVVDPNKIKDTGKIEWFSELVSDSPLPGSAPETESEEMETFEAVMNGPSKVASGDTPSNDPSVDEGVCDMDTDVGSVIGEQRERSEEAGDCGKGKGSDHDMFVDQNHFL